MANIFISFLTLLKIKHTTSYTNQYFEQHPYKYSLFGLSKMLTDYGIENVGVKIEDKEIAIKKLTTPFIAHLGTEFVIVDTITSEKIRYIWNGNRITVKQNIFIEKWSGNCLFTEVNGESGEPDYKNNLFNNIIQNILKFILWGAITLFFIISFFHNHSYSQWGHIFLLLLSFTGIYISYLLVQKQMDIQNKYADKICSLFWKNDCNNILDTSAAKLVGTIGWSEIGLGYFISNVIIVLLFPSLILYLAILNIFALPYTVWSIWFQKYKAKQWCMLCLIIQVLLWGVFCANLLFNYVQLPSGIIIPEILLFGTIYTIPILSIHLIIPILTKSKKSDQILYEINSLKMNDIVFLSLLREQQKIDLDFSDSAILFGDLNSKLRITILTNPHCQPCARMHKRINKLLKDTNNEICIQYVFSSFDKSLDTSCYFLISVYFNQTKDKREKVFNDWFSGKSYVRESFFEENNFSVDEQAIQEFNKHTQWKEKHKLGVTPTIIVNGYKLPDKYKIEDLRYFIDFEC